MFRYAFLAARPAVAAAPKAAVTELLAVLESFAVLPPAVAPAAAPLDGARS
ncbi:hypothetical protein [Streptomyces sp. NPDC051561]|uniref:hypothetical protein n=1 Tax=Streptomyces sp. NPDC051561 TaxID=3365658 RepID=UPI0037B5D325